MPPSLHSPCRADWINSLQPCHHLCTHLAGQIGSTAFSRATISALTLQGRVDQQPSAMPPSLHSPCRDDWINSLQPCHHLCTHLAGQIGSTAFSRATISALTLQGRSDQQPSAVPPSLHSPCRDDWINSLQLCHHLCTHLAGQIGSTAFSCATISALTLQGRSDQQPSAVPPSLHSPCRADRINSLQPCHHLCTHLAGQIGSTAFSRATISALTLQGRVDQQPSAVPPSLHSPFPCCSLWE